MEKDKTVQSNFTNAANSVNAFSLRATKQFLPAALELFAKKYPEHADPENEDMYEDFSVQQKRGGFLQVLIESVTHKAKGLSAGFVYKESKTASLTYFVTEENDEKNLSRLRTETFRNLKTRGAAAVFGELYAPGHENNVVRDSNERELYKKLGAVAVPVTYEQPRESGSDFYIPGLSLSVIFIKDSLTNAEKSELVINHLTAFTRLYDPQLENPANKKLLARYKEQLENVTWNNKQTPPEPSAP